MASLTAWSRTTTRSARCALKALGASNARFTTRSSNLIGDLLVSVFPGGPPVFNGIVHIKRHIRALP